MISLAFGPRFSSTSVKHSESVPRLVSISDTMQSYTLWFVWRLLKSSHDSTSLSYSLAFFSMPCVDTQIDVRSSTLYTVLDDLFRAAWSWR